MVRKPPSTISSTMTKIVANMVSDGDAEKEHAAQNRLLQCAILVSLPPVMDGVHICSSLAHEKSSYLAPPAVVTRCGEAENPKKGNRAPLANVSYLLRRCPHVSRVQGGEPNVGHGCGAVQFEIEW